MVYTISTRLVLEDAPAVLGELSRASLEWSDFYLQCVSFAQSLSGPDGNQDAFLIGAASFWWSLLQDSAFFY